MTGFDRIWHPAVLRRLEVLRVTDLTPTMRRITVGGAQLDAFHREGRDLRAFHTGGFDDHVKLFFPAPGEAEPVLPVQDDGHLDWPTDGSRPVHRDYTVRRYDPGSGELDIDVVIHAGGVASDWSVAAAVGDRIHLAGPRTSHVVPPGERYLLVGDETALPAIARFAEECGPDEDVRAVVEITEDSGRQEMAIPVTWVRAASGSLLAAVRAMEFPAEGTVAWVAGEADVARRVRVHLTRERGLVTVHTTGYWRRGAKGDERDDRPARIRTLADSLTPTALRTAVTLGIPDRLASGPRDAAELAADCGTAPRATLALLRFLAVREILTEIRPGVVALAELGEVLLDALPRTHLDLDGAAGHMERAWAGLPHSVRTGQAGYPTVFGRGFWAHLDADPALANSFDLYLDRWAAEWTPPAAKALSTLGCTSVVDVGGGTGLLLAALLAEAPDVRGTLVEQAGSARRARKRFHDAGLASRCDVVEGSFFDRLPAGGDVYVLAQVLHDWPDDDAVRILRRCADATGPRGRVVLVERVLDEHRPALEHVAMDLRMLVLFGSHERSRDELAALATRAGLTIARVAPAGHEMSLVELTPR